MRWFGQVNGAVQNITGWFAFFGLLAAAFTWLGKGLTVFGNLGWAEAVFLGVGTAAVLTLVLSAFLVAWRFFKPLAKDVIAPVQPTNADEEEALQDVIGKGFVRCEVRVAGKHFQHCKFDNVTFVFGPEPFRFTHNDIGPFNINVTAKGMEGMLELLVATGMLNINLIADHGDIIPREQYMAASGNQTVGGPKASPQAGAQQPPPPTDTEEEKS